jgi:hypothetical protein
MAAMSLSKWPLIFLVVSMIVFGFGGIAASADIGRVLLHFCRYLRRSAYSWACCRVTCLAGVSAPMNLLE